MHRGIDCIGNDDYKNDRQKCTIISLCFLIAPFIDISKFLNQIHLTMHKVQMHPGAIRK